MIANLQALEAIKLLIGQCPSLAGKVLRFNGNDMKFRIDELQRNENCKVCGPSRLTKKTNQPQSEIKKIPIRNYPLGRAQSFQYIFINPHLIWMDLVHRNSPYPV